MSADPKDRPGWTPEAGEGASASSPASSPRWSFNFKGTVTVTVSVAVSLGIGYTAGRLSAPSTSTVTTHPVAVVAASTSPAATVSNTATGATATSSTSPLIGASGIGTVSLTDLTPASTTFLNPDKNPLVNGKAQLLSISALVGDNGYGSCNQLSGDAEYDLGRDYTKFTALIGIDDSSADEKLNPTVEIDGDGLKLAMYTPTLGHPATVSINVTNVLRLDIKWSDPGAACTINYLVVGNGQLTTIPGYTPTSSSPSS